MKILEILFLIMLILPIILVVANIIFKISGKIYWRLSSLLSTLILIISSANLFVSYYNKDFSMQIFDQSHYLEFYSDSFLILFVIDSLSSPFIWCCSLVFMSTIMIGKDFFFKNPKNLSVVLVLQSAMNGLLLSTNFYLMSFFIAFSIIPIMFLLGMDENQELRKLSIKTGFTYIISFLIMLLCYIGLYELRNGSLNEWLAFDILGYSYGDLEIYCSLFIFAILLNTSLFPLFLFKKEYVNAVNLPPLIPIISLGNLGFYLFLRFVIPFFQINVLNSAKVISILGLVTVLISVISIFSERNNRKKCLLISVFHTGFMAIALSTFTYKGILGLMIFNIFSIIVVCACLNLCVIFEKRNIEANWLNLCDSPFLQLLNTYISLSMYLLPVSFGFYALLFTFWGSFFSFPLLIILILLMALVIFSFSFFKSLFESSKLVNSTHPNTKLEFNEYFSCSLLLFSLVVLSVFPNFIISFASGAVENLMSVLSI